MRSHMEMRAAEFEQQGMSAHDALAAAHKQFGSTAIVHEDTRRMHLGPIVATAEAAARELSDGVEKADGNDAETGFAATFVEGAGRDVAREIAAEGGEFVVDPEGELRAITPQKKSAEDKNGVAETGKNTESGTRTPIKHKSSPQPGGNHHASS